MRIGDEREVRRIRKEPSGCGMTISMSTGEFISLGESTFSLSSSPFFRVMSRVGGFLGFVYGIEPEVVLDFFAEPFLVPGDFCVAMLLPPKTNH